MLEGYQIPPFLTGRGNVYVGHATVTAPAIWTGTALTGPLLYNGSNVGGARGVTAYILGVGFGLSVAATVAGSVGICGGATVQPTSTTAITSSSNLRLNSEAVTPSCSIYAAGTVGTAATFFMPIGQLGTAALTVELADDNFVHLGGAIEVTAGYFACFAASATLSTAVMNIGLIWLELPKE